MNKKNSTNKIPNDEVMNVRVTDVPGRVYVTPALKHLGHVLQLTQAGSFGNTESSSNFTRKNR